MSSKIKNIIMIILIVVLCVAMYFTISYPNNNFKGNNPEMENSEDFKNIPENKGEMGERPEIPQNNGEMTEPPEKPEGEEQKVQQENSTERNMQRQSRPENINGNMPDIGNIGKNNFIVNILVGVEGLLISLIFIYLIMSKFNKLTFKETLGKGSKITIYVILVIVIAAGIIILTMYLSRNTFKMEEPLMEETSEEKETTAESVDAGINVTDENIDLSKYSSNITITNAGNYTLTGQFNNSVLINADGEVTLNLSNVTIKNDVTAAIANISTNNLIINLPENTESTLSDGGSSEYDGCIYSAGALTITGNGILNVYGNQEEGEGIATETSNITINGGNINIECNDDGINAGGDGGTITINNGTIYIKASGDGIDSNKDIIINGGSVYAMGSSVGGDAGIDADEGVTINGGSVIALGSDMLEKPLEASKQNSLSFSLDSVIGSGTTISIKDENNIEIATFEANENFKTLIISNDKIEKGKYYLYKNGEQITEIENK